MKKQIILAIAIVFVVMYLTFSFVKLEIDFRLWSENNRLAYIFSSILYGLIISWSILFLKND